MRLCIVTGGTLALLAVPGAAAEPADEPEKIVVTGERVERSLGKTPSSVSVYTADSLAALPDADRLDKILDLTPNVTFGSGSLGPTIRGQDSTGALQDLPAFLGGNRSRVTLQVDGRPVGYNEFVFGAAPLWDIAQVEVFRSPQSTTQGRNAIAGAIFVTSRDPVFAWEGAARASLGSNRQRQVSAMLSGPLIDDQLAFRVAGDWRSERTASRITDLMPGADPNEDGFGLMRFKLLATPRGVPGLKAKLTFVHSQSSAPQSERVTAPFRKRRDPTPAYGVFKIDVDSLTANFDHALSGELGLRATASAGWTSAQRYPRPGLGRADNRSRDFTFETLLTWSRSAEMKVTGGVNALSTRLDQAIDLTAVIGRGTFDDRQRSLGLFGEATVSIAPRVTMIAGLRYQRDSQRRSGQFDNALLPLPLDFDESFSAWLPKLSLAYEFRKDLTAGLLVQRAYNPGGVTLNFDTGEEDLFEPETLWAYELFTRARLGRLHLSANAFFNAIRSAQRSTLFPYSVPGGATAFWAVIDNFPKARTYGLEATARWRATERLTLQGAIGLLRTRIVETVVERPALDGNEFGRSPHLTASGSLDWRPLERLRLSASIRHNSGYFSDDANSASRRIGRATRIDAKAAYDLGKVVLSAYARNLLDDFNMTYLFSASSGIAMDPREVGLGLEARF